MADIKIYGRLVNDTPDGTIAKASQVKDETQNKFQSDINADLSAKSKVVVYTTGTTVYKDNIVSCNGVLYQVLADSTSSEPSADNGDYRMLSAEIKQEAGDAEDKVMSQKATSDEFTALKDSGSGNLYLKSMASSGIFATLEIGEYGFSTAVNILYQRIGEGTNQNIDYRVVALNNATRYIYNGSVYKWDGNTLVFESYDSKSLISQETGSDANKVMSQKAVSLVVDEFTKQISEFSNDIFGFTGNYIEGWYRTDGTLITNRGSNTGRQYIKAGNVIKYRGFYGGDAAAVIWYDENDAIIGQESIEGTIKERKGTFTSPEGTSYFIASSYSEEILEVSINNFKNDLIVIQSQIQAICPLKRLVDIFYLTTGPDSTLRGESVWISGLSKADKFVILNSENFAAQRCISENAEGIEIFFYKKSTACYAGIIINWDIIDDDYPNISNARENAYCEFTLGQPYTTVGHNFFDLAFQKKYTLNGNAQYNTDGVIRKADILWVDGTAGTINYYSYDSSILEYNYHEVTYKDFIFRYYTSFDEEGNLISNNIITIIKQ